MNTLHIVGNGFDLHHGIKTKYSDFFDYAWKHSKNSQLLAMLEECYSDIRIGCRPITLWKDLETVLGLINFENTIKVCSEDIDSIEDHESRYQVGYSDSIGAFLPGMFKHFHSIFEEWVENIDLATLTEPDLCIPEFDRSGLFLTFNYTETLELLYDIDRSQICYIHGRRGTKDEIIVGHGTDIRTEDNLPDNYLLHEYQAYSDISKIVSKEKKPISSIILKYDKFWKSLGQINKVVIYGHSLSPIDRPYFSKVAHSVLPDAKWFFSTHNTIGSDTLSSKESQLIRSLHVGKNLCHVFKF